MSRPMVTAQFHKRRSLLGSGALAVLAVAALGATTAGPALAAPIAPAGRPRVIFSFRHNRIRSNMHPVVRYTVWGLPRGAKLELQRQFGTAHVWKNVTWLRRRHSGTKVIPKVRMGRYDYRVRVYKKTRTGKVRTVVLSRRRLLYSYGRIPLTNICNDQNNNGNIVVYNYSGNCQTSTVQVGSTVFTYLLEDGGSPAQPGYDHDIEFGTKTSCRTISLQFAMDNNAQPADTATIELVQASADAQSKSVGQGVVGSAYFKLAGGPWYLNSSSSNYDNVYINGYLSCWSRGGIG